LVKASDLGPRFHALERTRECEDAALAFALGRSENDAADADAGTAHARIG
jgi:hypothetical protein